MPTRWRSPPDSRCRRAVEQAADVEQVHRLVERHPALRLAARASAVFQIGRARQMREQAGLLEYIAERALVNRLEHRRVLPDVAVHRQRAAWCVFQSGDGTQQRGLAGSGMAEQGGDAASGQVEVDVEREAGVIELEAGANAGIGIHARRPLGFNV